MELKSYVRDMDAVENGAWVDASDVPGLGDMRVKVRGLKTKAMGDERARLVRAGMADEDALATIIAQKALVEIEGLTNGGKPVTADQIRDKLSDPEFDPLAALILAAIFVVDGKRAGKEVDLAKN